jgi:hypothetical protein
VEKKRINFQNREVEVTPLTYRAAGEHWNEYLVDDGTVVRVKLVVTEILRIDGQYDNDRNPLYVVRSGNVIVVSSPESIRKQNSPGD